jgi:hypothetical protein
MAGRRFGATRPQDRWPSARHWLPNSRKLRKSDRLGALRRKLIANADATSFEPIEAYASASGTLITIHHIPEI